MTRKVCACHRCVVVTLPFSQNLNLCHSDALCPPEKFDLLLYVTADTNRCFPGMIAMSASCEIDSKTGGCSRNSKEVEQGWLLAMRG